MTLQRLNRPATRNNYIIRLTPTPWNGIASPVSYLLSCHFFWSSNHDIPLPDSCRLGTPLISHLSIPSSPSLLFLDDTKPLAAIIRPVKESVFLALLYLRKKTSLFFLVLESLMCILLWKRGGLFVFHFWSACPFASRVFVTAGIG